MEINLRALNLSRAELVKPTSDNTFKKVSENSIKENIDEIKKSSVDLLELSGRTINISGKLKVLCDYSSDVFFSKEMPDQVNENGNFVISHTEFSREELEQCRVVMKSATCNMDIGIGKNANIDYRNYAQMGISYSIVKDYAENNFTNEQSEVIKRAMEAYNSLLIDLEKETLSQDNFISSSMGEISKYYGIQRVLSENEVRFIDEFRERYGNSGTQISMATLQSATNTEVISKLQDIFSQIDASSDSSLTKAFSEYKELVKPVYLASGLSSNDANKQLNIDISNFKKQVSNVLASTNYRVMDAIV